MVFKHLYSCGPTEARCRLFNLTSSVCITELEAFFNCFAGIDRPQLPLFACVYLSMCSSVWIFLMSGQATPIPYHLVIVDNVMATLRDACLSSSCVIISGSV